MKEIKLNIVSFVLFIMATVVLPYSISAQKIVLKRSDLAQSQKDAMGREYTLLKGNIWFVQGTVNIYCDEARVYKTPEGNHAIFEGNLKIVDKDVTITSRKGFYYSNNQLMQLRENVVFRQKDGITVYTDFLDYDRSKREARYFNGGRLVDQESVLTSDRGYFDEITGMASFKSKVDGKSPEWKLDSDTLQYNTRERIIYFHDKTRLVDTQGNMAEYYSGQYNTITKQSQLKTGKFETDTYVLEGNSISIDDVNKFYTARGQVFLRSKTDDLIVTGETAFYDQNRGITKIFDNPVMKRALQPGDTMYLLADTLLSVETENDSNEVLYAYNNVRVFKSDMQATSDSLIYSRDDSVIFFFNNPIMWAKGTQLTADTIDLTIAGNSIDKLHLVNNGFIIFQDTLKNYNQIKGRKIDILFNNNEINRVEVEGNGETIYYVLEEQDTKVTGLNRVTCSRMSIRFEQTLIKRIVFYQNMDGTFTPPHEIKEKATRLDGFNWRETERPKLDDVANKRETVQPNEKLE